MTEPQRAPVRPSHVFIVGCNRSGTSLLRDILNGSPDVAIAPETHFLRRLSAVGGGRQLERIGRPRDAASTERFVAHVYSGGRTFGAAYWAWLQRNVPRPEFARQLAATDGSDRAIFSLLMSLFMAVARPDRVDVIPGEKTPTHLHSVPALLAWYPGARIVHVMRDPRAVVSSKLRKVRTKGREGPRRWVPWLPERVIEAVSDPIEVVHTVREWRAAARLDADYRRRFDAAYTSIRFEDVVRRPEPSVRALCAELGLEFDPAMLAVDVVGSAYGGGHRGAAGFDPSALERWRREIGPLVGPVVSAATHGERRRLGYG